MIYALDTNIISFLLRPTKNSDVVAQFERAIELGEGYAIPPQCYFEIKWHLLWKDAPVQMDVFEGLYRNASVNNNMGEAELDRAARIKADLLIKGTPIGDADIFIAAYCLVNNYVLVTDNTGDFARIDGLKYVNWKK